MLRRKAHNHYKQTNRTIAHTTINIHVAQLKKPDLNRHIALINA